MRPETLMPAVAKPAEISFCEAPGMGLDVLADGITHTARCEGHFGGHGNSYRFTMESYGKIAC